MIMESSTCRHVNFRGVAGLPPWPSQSSGPHLAVAGLQGTGESAEAMAAATGKTSLVASAKGLFSGRNPPKMSLKSKNIRRTLIIIHA